MTKELNQKFGLLFNKRVAISFLGMVLYCLFAVSVVRAQITNESTNIKKPKNSHSFLQIGAIGSNYSVRDESTSPLLYSGFHIGSHLGFLSYTDIFRYSIDYDFLYGRLSTRNYPNNDSNRAHSYCNYLNTNVLFCLKNASPNSIGFWVGGDINLIVNIRSNSKFNNANVNYDGFVSLGPMFSIEKLFDLKQHEINLGLFNYPLKDRKLKVIFSGIIPVITGVYRPGYSVIDDFVDGQRIILNRERLKLVSYGNYLSITSKIDVYYYLHNGNMFKFGYTWNYYNYYPEFNSVKSLNNSLEVSIVFRLNSGSK